MNNPFLNEFNFSAYIRAQVKDLKIGEARFIDCKGEPRNKLSGTLSNLRQVSEGIKFRTKKDAQRDDGYWVQRVA